MSQPTQSYSSKILKDTIISPGQLVDIFIKAEKKPTHFVVGVEHERFGFQIATNQPLPYEGKSGIRSVLKSFQIKAQSDNVEWTSVLEKENLIALQNGNASISLEPGGQLELSGALCKDIFAIDKEISQYESWLVQIAKQLKINFLSVGYNPTASRADISWMPKARYEIMQNYMPKVGKRGLDMMLRTCTVQANLDYVNEADMVSSFKIGLLLSPVATALFANSPFADGKPSGFLSERMRVWFDTDADRSGFPAVAFAPNFGYEAWVQYVLSVPMYFIRRDGKYVDVAGASFDDFIKNGLMGYQATISDFMDHLSTVFTEVRLRPYLELRSADVGPGLMLRALPAFWKGILYNNRAKEKVLELMGDVKIDELKSLHFETAKYGFDALFRGVSILSLVEKILTISKDGLIAQSKENKTDVGEDKFLLPLFEIVTKKQTHAQKLLQLYNNEWNGNINKIYSTKPFVLGI